MRFAVLLLVIAAAGMIFGASLIGQWAVGLAIIAVSALLGWWALFGEVAEKARLTDLEASRGRMRRRARDAA